MPSKEEIKFALADLGRDPETIAETLESWNVKGRTNSPMSCPLAQWLKREFPGKDVLVHSTTAIVDDVSVPLEQYQTSFVRKVDSQEFPKLTN